jgi:hypothetical protein
MKVGTTPEKHHVFVSSRLASRRRCRVIRLILRKRPMPSRSRSKGVAPSEGKAAHPRASINTHDVMPRSKTSNMANSSHELPTNIAVCSIDHPSRHKLKDEAAKRRHGKKLCQRYHRWKARYTSIGCLHTTFFTSPPSQGDASEEETTLE